MTIANFHISISRFIPGVFLLLLLTLYDVCKAQTADKGNLEHVGSIPTNDPFPESSFLTTKKEQGVFTLVEDSAPSGILVSDSDHAGVLRVAGLFQKDLSRVSGREAELTTGDTHTAKNLIIAGTVGKSKLIDQLAAEGKIDVSELEGKWEQFLIIPVKQPINLSSILKNG